MKYARYIAAVVIALTLGIYLCSSLSANDPSIDPCYGLHDEDLTNCRGAQNTQAPQDTNLPSYCDTVWGTYSKKDERGEYTLKDIEQAQEDWNNNEFRFGRWRYFNCVLILTDHGYTDEEVAGWESRQYPDIPGGSIYD